jgi:hypothetical protein
MDRNGHQGIEETAGQRSCSFLTSGDARGRSGVRVSAPPPTGPGHRAGPCLARASPAKHRSTLGVPAMLAEFVAIEEWQAHDGQGDLRALIDRALDAVLAGPLQATATTQRRTWPWSDAGNCGRPAPAAVLGRQQQGRRTTTRPRVAHLLRLPAWWARGARPPPGRPVSPGHLDDGRVKGGRRSAGQSPRTERGPAE